MTTPSKSAWIAASVAGVWVLTVGATMVVQHWYGLHRFGGIEYIPRVVALEVSRVWGAWGAAVATCLVVTGIFHGRSVSASTLETSPQSAEPHRPRSRARSAALAALAVPVLYAPVSALAFLASILVAWRWLGIPPRDFLEPIARADVQCGLLYAVAFGAVPAAWSLFGRRVWGTRRSLGLKLVVTYAVLFGISVVYRCAAALAES